MVEEPLQVAQHLRRAVGARRTTRSTKSGPGQVQLVARRCVLHAWLRSESASSPSSSSRRDRSSARAVVTVESTSIGVVRVGTRLDRSPQSGRLPRQMEHHFTGPSYTIGIEEELMIVDAESLDLVNAIESLLEDGADDGRDQARADGVGARDRDRPVPRTPPRPASSCARCAARCATTAARRGLTIGSAGTHPFAMWEDQRIVAAPALPRPDLRAALRRAPGADLRHARPRRHRRPRQGDPRRQRHARPRAGAARAERQLAVLARRRHRAWRRRACRSSARSRASGIPPTLRRLGRLRAPDRVHGRAAA